MLPGHFAFDIFNGGGVCLNYSDMLTDILIVARYEEATILNKMNDSVKVNYRPELKREVSKVKFYSKIVFFLIKPLSNKIGNHACTLICDAGKKHYIYDATNLTIFECLNNKEAICKIGSGTITLKPYLRTFFISNDANYNTLKKLCLTDKFIFPYSRKDFIYAWEEDIETFGANKSLIDDYHEDVYGDIKTIADNSRVLGKFKKKKRYKDIN